VGVGARRHVPVLGVAAEERVAHAAADDVRLVPRAVEAAAHGHGRDRDADPGHDRDAAPRKRPKISSARMRRRTASAASPERWQWAANDRYARASSSSFFTSPRMWIAWP